MLEEKHSIDSKAEYVMMLQIEPKALARPKAFFKHSLGVQFYNPSAVEQRACQFWLKKEMLRLKMPFFVYQPLQVDFIFSFKRPKTNKDPYKTTKPDIDNLIKFYLDAMNGVCFYDDKQVVQLGAEKRFGSDAYIQIAVRAL
jgi:Holliday junction resolvase RusA-like endonuclease